MDTLVIIVNKFTKHLKLTRITIKYFYVIFQLKNMFAINYSSLSIFAFDWM